MTPLSDESGRRIGCANSPCPQPDCWGCAPQPNQTQGTPREWWVIYGAVDKAMGRDLGTSPSMVTSAVHKALRDAGAIG